MTNKNEHGASTMATALFGIWRVVSKWFIVPLVGSLLGAMLIGRIAATILGPSSYKVYVVGNFIDEREDTINIPTRVWTAFKGVQLGSIHGVPVEGAKEYDLGDPLAAQQKAADLASRGDTLLVVGHFVSTQTKAALPVYLRDAQPPIPVIMTTETNPNLMPMKPREILDDPVFRLSPTDEEQAKTAADFAISKGATAFWVVEGLSNPVYSGFLTRKFCERVLERSRKVVIWTTNMNIPPVDAVRALKVDWVFFAGGWQDAIILARQVRAMPGGQAIRLLLSDASANPSLITQGEPEIDGAYLTHQMDVGDYERLGYGDYGTTALTIVQELIERANRNFGDIAADKGGLGYRIRRILGLKSANDARNVLVEVMNVAVRDQTSFRLAEGRDCVFVSGGGRQGASFHVWQIRGHKFAKPQ